MSLGLLAIIAGSMGGVFWAAIRTAGVAAHRTDGSSIASREIEAMRAVPYAEVGFYEDQTGYRSSFEDHATVTLGSTSSLADPPHIQPQRPDPSAATTFAPDPYPANAEPVVQSGVEFTIRRDIVWINAKDDTQTYIEAYKRLTVVVTWSDRAGDHEVRQDSILYPGGLGEYEGAQNVVTSTTATTVSFTPSAPILDPPVVPPDPTGRTEIDLTWSQPTGGAAVTSYTVEYSTDSSFPSGNTSAVTGIPAGATSYPVTALASSTTYYFRVTAYHGTNGATSNAQPATTLAQPVATCTLGALTVTGATSLSTTGTILKKHGNKHEMSENLTLGFSTTGSCTSTYQVRATNPSGTADTGSPYTLTSNGSGSWSGTVASKGQQGWAVGLHTFQVWDVTTGTATTAVKTFKVCAVGSTSC